MATKLPLDKTALLDIIRDFHAVQGRPFDRNEWSQKSIGHLSTVANNVYNDVLAYRLAKQGKA